MSKREWSGSGFGGVLGILIFLAGVALLLFTFKLAYDMFGMSPDRALGLKPGEAIDLNKAGQLLGGILLRVLVLIVMGIMASLIANRGVSLFAGSKAAVHHPPESTDQSTTERREA